MNPAEATYLHDTYRFLWSDEGIEIIADRLQETRGDLVCEMSVKTMRPFVGLLREGKFNLSATRTRTEWANAFEKRQPEIDWYAAIEQACTLALRHWREGAPFIDLSLVEPREDDAYLLRPYIIEGATSGVFADGGTGKSLFALAIGLSVATGIDIVGAVPARQAPVLYLDWEWDAEAHAERLQAIARGLDIEIPADTVIYRRESASIIESAASIRRVVVERGIGLVIIDSLGFARGGEPESAELTIKTFTALNSFGCPVLFVDHVAKHATDKSHSFGSVYTRNSARLMWRMDAPDQDVQAVKHIGLVNTKWNRRYQKPKGLLLTIESDDQDRLVSVRFDDAEPPLQSLGRGGIKEAVMAVLKANPEGLSITDIRVSLEAENFKATENVIGATLGKQANKAMFTFRDRRWFLVTESTVTSA